ncbi:hypothetical protein TWF106_009324 [Orbilia oligospora]|uniref:Uncharacterized protein n=1 Tax=Orbilia oligospora TaxID=2813651 RepID=A0A7C8UFC0_ORBOL|nr:hypothetical protein TWF106_009324 [Orbilia oligospora]
MHSTMFPDSHCASDELPALPLFSAADKHATQFPGKAALIDTKARRTFTYRELLAGTAKIKNLILRTLEVHGTDIQEQRIAYLVPPGIDHVQIQWGIWAAGGVAVPLCTTHPFHELEYTVTNSRPALIFIHHDFSQHKSSFLSTFPSIQVLDVPPSQYDTGCPRFSIPTTLFYPAFSLSRRALIIYTSGTTSRPKGCVTTHANIHFQANSLTKAWMYASSDHLIHVLPLHHVHGIINGLTATLLAGGTVELHPKFDPVVVWRRWMDGDSTIFMAVPTVYSRLNNHFLEHISGTDDEQRAKDGTRKLRLTVSGSAALPTSIKQRFEEITGQVLLERYGMTEIGMGLSCRYDNSDGLGRPDGSVGWPLDGVEVRLMHDSGQVVPFGSQSTVTTGENGGSDNNILESQTQRRTRSNNDETTFIELQGIDNPAQTEKVRAGSRAERTRPDSRSQSVERHMRSQSTEGQAISQDIEENTELYSHETHPELGSPAVLPGAVNTDVSSLVLNSGARIGKSNPQSLESPSESKVSVGIPNPEPQTGAFMPNLTDGATKSGKPTTHPIIERGTEEVSAELPTLAQSPYTHQTKPSIEVQNTNKSTTGVFISGEIQIRGPNVFKEYWENPDATAKEFTEDGYFKTGDIAYRDQHGAYYIQGRSSVDIIKSGGYKVSALEVEREILSKIPDVTEVAVVGLPSEEWGERVAAVVVVEHGAKEMELKQFRNTLRSTLAPYKIPTLLTVVHEIERNAMGKVNKKQLIESLWPS